MKNNKLVLLAFCTNNQRELVAEAERRNFAVEVLVSDGTLFDKLAEQGTQYLVGVCCPAKIASISPLLEARGITYKAVEANAEGSCFKQTKVRRGVDMNQYRQALDWLESQ